MIGRMNHLFLTMQTKGHVFLSGVLADATDAITAGEESKEAVEGTLDVEGLLQKDGVRDGALKPVFEFVETYGGGGMSLGETIFVYVVGISVLILAIILVLHGRDRNKMSEVKDGVGWQIIGVVLGFGAVSFVVLMQSIGQSLFAGS